jgi:uncharacterized paraquat-inducible protein A
MVAAWRCHFELVLLTRCLPRAPCPRCALRFLPALRHPLLHLSLLFTLLLLLLLLLPLPFLPPPLLLLAHVASLLAVSFPSFDLKQHALVVVGLIL